MRGRRTGLSSWFDNVLLIRWSVPRRAFFVCFVRRFSSSSELTSEPFAATLNEGARFIGLRASPQESARRTGARGRDRREDDEVVDIVDTERRRDEREACIFHCESAVPEDSSVVEEGVETLRV